ncbi:unnamed protein product [Closterium sp. Naga37s-1]|nr:unnamed protein product [Closterium sp. Naga37s-1]
MHSVQKRNVLPRWRSSSSSDRNLSRSHLLPPIPAKQRHYSHHTYRHHLSLPPTSPAPRPPDMLSPIRLPSPYPTPFVFGPYSFLSTLPPLTPYSPPFSLAVPSPPPCSLTLPSLYLPAAAPSSAMPSPRNIPKFISLPCRHPTSLVAPFPSWQVGASVGLVGLCLVLLPAHPTTAVSINFPHCSAIAPLCSANSPFTASNSPFTASNSPFTASNSALTAANSPFTIANSLSLSTTAVTLFWSPAASNVRRNSSTSSLCAANSSLTAASTASLINAFSALVTLSAAISSTGIA